MVMSNLGLKKNLKLSWFVLKFIEFFCVKIQDVQRNLNFEFQVFPEFSKSTMLIFKFFLAFLCHLVIQGGNSKFGISSVKEKLKY